MPHLGPELALMHEIPRRKKASVIGVSFCVGLDRLDGKSWYCANTMLAKEWRDRVRVDVLTLHTANPV